MRFRLGCTLDYVVPEPSVFIFNVAVARCPRQRLVREELSLAPALTPEELVMPATGARFTRLDVPAGRLSLRYEAEVERATETEPHGSSTSAGIGHRMATEKIHYL